MAIHNNTPTFTWLKIQGTTITHNNKVYMVEDLKTNLEYIYWELDNPYKLKATNVNLGVSGNRFLILKNNRGEGILVPNDYINVSFDGNSMQMAEDKVFGLVEKVDEHSGKFVTVEQDVNGIKQNVGTWSNENGTITENISSIKETSTNIDLSVKDLDKTFNDNKATNELREKINKSIIDFNAELGIFNGELSGFFKDSIVSSDENVSINTYLSAIDNKVSEIVLNIDTAISLADIQGQTTHKNSMISEKDGFVASVSNLKNYITNAISDNVFTTTDITGIINMFSKCNMKISSLKNTVDDFIFLGSGGKIIEELARIGVKSNEIILSVSSTEESLKTNIGIEKNILQGNITDVKNANYDLKSKFNSIASDGSASLEEKTIIYDTINKLNTEKNDVVNKYNELYSNIYISTNIKNELKIEFDNFNNKSTETINKINDVILDGFINDAEKNQVDTLLNEYIIKLISLQSKMSQSIDDVEKNTVKAEIQKAKDDLQIEILDVDKKIGDLNTYVDGTFLNNILDSSERKSISQSLDTIIREKSDIDSHYTQLYNSVELDGALKVDYKNAYDDYILKHNSVVSIINGILSKVTLIDNEDRANLSNAYININTSLSLFSKKSNEVIDYIYTKKTMNMKTEIQVEISDVDLKIDKLITDIDTTISDGIIDEAESVVINNTINELNKEKLDVDSRYEFIYNNVDLIDDAKVNLYDAKVDFDLKSLSFITVINEITLDNVITDEERITLDTSRTQYKTSLSSISKIFDEAIDSISSKKTTDAKVLLQSEIGDVSDAVNTLQSTMEGAFKDGVLSDSEKNAIKQNLQTIGNEKTDVDNGYPVTYNNSDLVGDAKTNLLNAYNEYISQYNLLVVAINNILNKVGIVDITDQANLNAAFVNYRTSSGVYSQRINEAIDSIASKKAMDAETNSKSHTDSQITILQDSIDLKVSSNDVVNSINLSTEGIKINASKLNITGLVTFSDLSTPGATTVSGSNIESGTIKGCLLETYASDSSKGVRIQPESIQLNDTSMFFDSDGKFKIQAINNIGISSRNDIHLMPRVNADGTMTYNGYLNVGGHCKVVSLTSNETMKLYNTTLYSPYSSQNHQCDVLKLGGINLGAVSSGSIHLVTTGGAKANLYANFFGTVNGVTVGATSDDTVEMSLNEQLLQEDFATMDYESNKIIININEATMSLYKRNKDLEKENLILKQTQIEQDEVAIESAYQIALIKLQ